MCEFCGTRNEVDVVAEEIPKEEGALFKIAPATPAKTSMARDSLVVFCMDTSGSMCVTTEVRLALFEDVTVIVLIVGTLLCVILPNVCRFLASLI